MSGPWDQFGGGSPEEEGPWSNFAGAQPPAAAPPKTGAIRRIAGDMIGTPLLQGAVGVPEAAVGLVDLATGGRVGKALQEGVAIPGTEAYLRYDPAAAKKMIGDALYSDPQKEANQRVADAEGFLPTLQAAVENPSVIARTAVESVPGMLAGGVIGRIAGAAAPGISAVARGAIGEGAITAGQNAEQVRQEDPRGLLTPGQSALMAGSGAVTGVISRLSGGLAGRLGIGDIETAAAGGGFGRAASTAATIERGGVTFARQADGSYKSATGVVLKEGEKGFLRKAAEGFVTEGVLEELPQSMQEQVAQNLAQGKAWNDGLGNAAALGLLTGGVTGAAVGPLHSEHPEEKPPAPKPLLLTHDPDPLIGFPDGTVARRSEIDRYLASLPPEEATAVRAKMLGINPQSEQAAGYTPPPPPAGPITRAANVAPPPESLPKPEGEGGKSATGVPGESDKTPARPPAVPLDPNAGPISRAAALAQQATAPAEVTKPAAAPEDSSQTSAPRETAPAQASGYTPQPGEIVVDEHFDAAHRGATSPLNDRPEPTDPQKEAENYATGKTRVGGMTVSIENGQGTERKGTDEDGNPWSTLMKDHYGRLLGTIGADSTPAKRQHLDVFIKTGTPKNWAGSPVVIDTKNPRTGKFDEHKIIFGADSEADARAVFARNYDDGERRIMSATQVPMPEFKAWAYDGTKKADPYRAPAPRGPSAARQRAQQDLQAALGDLGALVGQRAPAAAPEAPAAAPDAATVQQRRVERRKSRGSEGRAAQRSESYDKNPLMTFLATHGLYHQKGDPRSLKNEFSPDAHVTVPGYHISVFRRNGLLIDELLPSAIQDGYLPPGADERDLYDLVAAAFRGQRIIPIYGEGQAEREMERRTTEREDSARAEADAAAQLADFDDDLLVELAQNLDDVPALDAPSSVDLEAGMRAMGFSDEEIRNAVEATARPEEAPAAGARGGGAVQAPEGPAAGDRAERDQQAGAQAAAAQGEVAPGPEAAAPSQRAGTAAPDAAPAAQSQAERTPEAPPDGGRQPPEPEAAASTPAPTPGPAPEGAANALPSDRQRVLQSLQPGQHGGKLSAARIGGILGDRDKPGTSIGTQRAQGILDLLEKEGLVERAGRSYQLTAAGKKPAKGPGRRQRVVDDDERSFGPAGAPQGVQTDLELSDPAVRAGAAPHNAEEWEFTQDEPSVDEYQAAYDNLANGMFVQTPYGYGARLRVIDVEQPEPPDRRTRVVTQRIDKPVGKPSYVGVFMRDGKLYEDAPGDLQPDGHEESYPRIYVMARAWTDEEYAAASDRIEQRLDREDQEAEKGAPRWNEHGIAIGTPTEQVEYRDGPSKITVTLFQMPEGWAVGTDTWIGSTAVGSGGGGSGASRDHAPLPKPTREEALATGLRIVRSSLESRLSATGGSVADSVKKAAKKALAWVDKQLGTLGEPQAVAAPAAPATPTADTVVNGRERAPDVKPEESLLLMPCGDTKAFKADGRARAIDTYQGSMWQTFRAHPVDETKLRIAILSAKHGFMDPNKTLTDYNEQMTDERAAELVEGIRSGGRIASGMVIKDLASIFEKRGRDASARIRDVQIVGGGKYREVMRELVAKLVATGRIDPGASVRETTGFIGQQRQQLGTYLDGFKQGAAVPASGLLSDEEQAALGERHDRIAERMEDMTDAEIRAMAGRAGVNSKGSINVVQKRLMDLHPDDVEPHLPAEAAPEGPVQPRSIDSARGIFETMGVRPLGAERLNDDLARFAVSTFNDFVEDFAEEGLHLADYTEPGKELQGDLQPTLNLARTLARSLRDLIDGQTDIAAGKGSSKVLEAAQNHLKSILGKRVSDLFLLTKEGGEALTPEALQPLIDKWKTARAAEDDAQKKVKPEKRQYRTNPNVLQHLESAQKDLRAGKIDDAREYLGSMVGMGKGKGNWAGTIDSELRALLRAHDVATQPAAAPAPVKQTKAEKEHQARIDALAGYFAPGNIVPSYGGHDRVIEFIPKDSRGSWSVKVHAVVKQGDTWVDDPKDNRDRQHSTMPSERDLKAGPTATVAAAPAAAASPAIPEGYKPFGEPYYRDGVLTQGYSKFAPGERVRDTETQHVGTVDAPMGAGPIWDKLLVKFPLGTATVPVSRLEAAPQEGAAAAQPRADAEERQRRLRELVDLRKQVAVLRRLRVCVAGR